jgi:hypothetical protein
LERMGTCLHLLGRAKGDLARGRGHVALGRAQEEPRVQRFFQRGQPPAGGGLVDLQFGRGAAQCAAAVWRERRVRCPNP